MAGEVAESGGLVLVPGEFEDEDPDVADGGEHLGCGACADLRSVLFECDVADVVLDLNAPVAAGVVEQLGGAGLRGGQAGDAGDGLGGEDVPVAVAGVALEEEDLVAVREGEVGGGVGDADAAFLVAALVPLGDGGPRAEGLLGEGDELVLERGLVSFDLEDVVGVLVLDDVVRGGCLGVECVLFRPVRYADLADGQACLAWSLPASTAWPFRWSA